MRNTDSTAINVMDIADPNRSEEHTSELQSQSNLVCRLLLEKKKKHTLHRNQSQTHPQLFFASLSTHAHPHYHHPARRSDHLPLPRNLPLLHRTPTVHRLDAT